MNLTLVHGARKHQVQVVEETTVKQLREIVSELTMIPEFKQKLIYKGITITKDEEKSMSDFKIKKNSKIMVIGQRHDPEEESVIRKIDHMDKLMGKIDETIQELMNDLDSLKKGFIDQSLMPKSVERLKKCVLRCTEDGMKVVESLDELMIEEKFKDARGKRKQLVKRAQTILDKCDKLADDITDVDAK